MGVDYGAFSCLGYQLCESNFNDPWDYDDLEQKLRKDYKDNDICVTRSGCNYSEETSVYIYFKSMFVNGVYQAAKQTMLDSIVRTKNLKVIGDFKHYSVLDVS